MDAYQSDFSHDDEIARPGYHKILLKTCGVTAELTSTIRVGLHRYTFPSGTAGGVLFDTGASLMDKISTSEVRRVSDTEVEGLAVMAPTSRRPKSFTVYFVAQFNRPIKGFGAWCEGRMVPGPVESVSGRAAGAYVVFSPDPEPLLMKVAISYTSIGGARLNLAAEVPHWDFDRVVAESRDQWNRWLNCIEVEGGTPEERTRFYTDLWHSLLGRRIVSDADGAYCDNTGDATRVCRVRTGPDGRPLFAHHNFDAFWGAHWSVNLLWSLAYPEVMDAFCNTMVDMYRNGGLIPRGPSGGNYTFVMIDDARVRLSGLVPRSACGIPGQDRGREALRLAGDELQEPVGRLGGLDVATQQGWIVAEGLLAGVHGQELHGQGLLRGHGRHLHALRPPRPTGPGETLRWTG